MSTAVHPSAATPGPARSTERVVAARAFRQLRVGAALVGLTCALSVYATAAAYHSTVPTAQARRQAADAVAGDTGVRILLGPIGDIGTIGGYTVYKNYVFLTTLGAVWAVLAGTRVLRGEEDAGRWQLQLAGATRPGRATLATLAALAAAVGLIGVLVTGAAVLTARDPALEMGTAGAVLHGLTLTAVPAVFAAVGAFTSQLARTRRGATGLGLGVVGVAFVLRMAADSGPSARWLAWTTPFGWAELVRPYTEDRAAPLGIALAATVALGAAAAVAAGRRDVGDGLLASRDTAPVRPFGLGSVLGLSLRLELPSLLAWVVGAFVAGLMMGVFAKITESAIPESLREGLARYGLGVGALDAFLGLGFLVLATVVALLPAAQVGAAAGEETSGRLTHLLAGAVPRWVWLGGRLAVTAGAVLVAAVVGAAGVYVGALAQGLRLDPLALLGAGLNVVPTGLVALGAGGLLLAVAPRAAAGTVYAVVVWSVLADLVAPLSGALEPVENVSLFHTMALLPAEGADPVALAVTTLVAAVLAAAALLLFRRRDVATG